MMITKTAHACLLWINHKAAQKRNWNTLRETLLPGALGIALLTCPSPFRISSEIEDAGFKIHPNIFVWAGYEPKNRLIPAVIFQNPHVQTPHSEILETGAGAYSITACRIKGPRGFGVWGTNQVNCRGTFNDSPGNQTYHSKHEAEGRWPANFALAHSPDCHKRGDRPIPAAHSGLPDEWVEDWDCSESCPVSRMNRQSEDRFGISRFFFQSNWEDRMCEFPLGLIGWFANLLLPPEIYQPRRLLISQHDAVPCQGASAQVGWEKISVFEV